MDVYYRKQDKSLGCINVDVDDFDEAIEVVKEHLLTTGEIPNGKAAVLASVSPISATLAIVEELHEQPV